MICVLGVFSPTLERWITSHLLGSEELEQNAAGILNTRLAILFVGTFQTAWSCFPSGALKTKQSY